MSARKQVIPTIRGRIRERFESSDARESSVLEFAGEPEAIVLRSAAERGAVGAACLLLETLREHGGTSVPGRPLEGVLRKLLGSFDARTNMEIEIEVYETLLWIGRTLDPNWNRVETEETAQDPRKGSIPLVHWSIAQQTDLEIDYYSRNRGELTTRTISPLRLDAETYLHAYCHLRREERIFRLSRIAAMKPVGGWKKLRSRSAKGNKPSDDRQMDLLEQVSDPTP
jgi:hypothetical protein